MMALSANVRKYKKEEAEGNDMKRPFDYLIIGLLIFAGLTYLGNREPDQETETTSQDERREIKRSEQASMGAYSPQEICRAAISSMFFHSPSIMKINKAGDEVYKVSYRRPSDNTLWETKCQLEGNRIHWGTFDGRWRTHEMDGVILFMALGNDLKIQENHYDGSTSTTRFTKQGDDSIVKDDA